jgi:hypothetical protein
VANRSWSEFAWIDKFGFVHEIIAKEW